ncbi:teneurin-a [Trichonephila clavipes]|nr:teneurin-a [Trichonephila clavipes]
MATRLPQSENKESEQSHHILYYQDKTSAQCILMILSNIYLDGLIDCADSECCIKDECKDNLMCQSAPDPLDILLRKQPPAVTATFYQKMKFLIEEDSVQSYAHRDEYSER